MIIAKLEKPDRTSVAYHSNESYRDRWPNAQHIANEVLKLSGLTTTRNNPQRVDVNLYELTANKGKLEEVWKQKVEIAIPFVPMTAEEYHSETLEVLREIPAQFHNYIKSQAYERGHHAGYEEVLNILNDIIGELGPAIADYRNHLCGVYCVENQHEAHVQQVMKDVSDQPGCLPLSDRCYTGKGDRSVIKKRKKS